MINNRQAGRRNRGRNNGRPNGNNRGGGDNGNRIDSRARGNAPQLLEKYRNMARDAQLSGDRVNAEYYLQFADHYFRVLADNRLRQEEQQQRHRRFDGNDDDYGDAGFDAGASFTDGDADVGDADSFAPQPPRRNERTDRRHQGDRQDRRPRYDSRNEEDLSAAPVAGEELEDSSPNVLEQEDAAPPRRRGRPPRQKVEATEQEGMDLTALPPSIGRNDDEPTADVEEAPRRRGRPRRAASAEAAE